VLRFVPLLILLGATIAQAQPFPAVGVAESVSTPTLTATTQQTYAASAVLQIPSHGVSGTVIYTAPGRTLILSCAHGHTGKDRTKPMTLNVPTASVPTENKRATIRLLAIGRPDNDDLTLIELADGPLPWVCPVAPRGHVPSRTTLSVGYDDMKWPATQRTATILTALTPTRERPWHGRSGGALIDQAGLLVGVCHGYTGPPTRQEVVRGGQGLYVSHGTIVQFLDGAGYGWLAGAASPPADSLAPIHQAPPPPAAGPSHEQIRQQLAAMRQQLALMQRQLELMQQLHGGYTPAPPPRYAPQQPPSCPDGQCPLVPPTGPRSAPQPGRR